jgi:hypothetical protein
MAPSHLPATTRSTLPEVPIVDALMLLGPTGSGKSALALDLAHRYPIEIISVDSAQVYLARPRHLPSHACRTRCRHPPPDRPATRRA